MKNLCIALICLILFASCKQKISQPNLVTYIINQKNGLLKEKDANGFHITVKYYPSDFFLINEVKNNVIKNIDSAKHIYNKYWYFIVNISKDGYDIFEVLNQLSPNDKDKLQRYFSNMAANVKIMNTTNYEITPLDCQLNRYFEVRKNTDFLFVFDNEKLIKLKTILFKIDFSELGYSEAKFEFKVNDILKTPSIF